MKAIILAAGRGSRLGKFTKGSPKCLLRLGKETILSREIRLLTECGISLKEIYVVGGYKHEELKEIVPNLIVNPFYDSKDNSYSLGLALQTVNEDDILIMDADLCFEKELLMEIIKDNQKNVLLSKVSKDLGESTGIVVADNGYVKAIGKQYRDTGYIYISIFKIGIETVDAFRDALLSEKSEKTWYPAAITEICDKYKFVNKVTKQKWHEIDFVEDYRETIELFGLEE